MSQGSASAEVAPGVRRLGSRWVNWYAVDHADGIVLVDAGLPAQRVQVSALVEALGAPRGAVTHVVLTHWHPDHTGCAAWVESELGATIWAPRGEAGVITGAEKARPPNFAPYLLRPSLLRYLGSVTRAGVLRVKPVEHVQPYDAASELPGGLAAIAAPGHTRDHHALLLERDGVLFCGDALATLDLLSGTPGPRPLLRRANHDPEAVVRSLEQLEEVDASVVLPGHGDPWRDGAAAAARRAREAGIPG